MSSPALELPLRTEAEAFQDRTESVVSQDCEFWFVWTKKGHVPRFAHDTEAKAIAEAKRLAAKHRGRKFIVLRASQKFHLPQLESAA